MKTIKIKSLKLTNFKGIGKLELNDLSSETFIYGANGTGKTTVFDSFVFLLFGKDSTDRKAFEAQPLDKNNNVIPKVEVQVTAVLEVNGERMELTRIMRQKWVKSKGALEPIFTGNETTYEWNGVPMNAGEYTSKINSIVDEKVFKMITNPSAFNSLKWQDQRDVLIDMSGNITDNDVAKGHTDFEALVFNLAGKSLDERKREVKASMTKSKAELKAIPTRIDEVERSKPDALDFQHIKLQLDKKNAEIETVNGQISDALKSQEADIEKQKAIQNEIHAIQTDISSTKHKLQTEASDKYNQLSNKPREIQREIESLDGEIKANENAISTRKTRISSYEHEVKEVAKKMTSLREEWENENAKVFKMDDANCECYACKRAFDPSHIEDKRKDLEAHFISNKNAVLKSIKDKGVSLGTEKTSLETQISELNILVSENETDNKTLWEKRADLSAKLKEVSIEKTQHQIYEELVNAQVSFFNEKNAKIQELQAALQNREGSNNTELREKLRVLNAEKDSLKSSLLLEDQIKQSNKRIEELSNEERVLAQAIADIEKELFTIEAFEKEKSTRIEESVNNRFQMVNFKLFDTQINGGEVPTCKALINGVPFSDANTASKINAGLDIINTLCKHYQANAPIFIDNRESVVELIPTDSQIINLIVSEADSKLRVVLMEMEETV